MDGLTQKAKSFATKQKEDKQTDGADKFNMDEVKWLIQFPPGAQRGRPWGHLLEQDGETPLCKGFPFSGRPWREGIGIPALLETGERLCRRCRTLAGLASTDYPEEYPGPKAAIGRLP